ncbi:MAG: GNAT family N-acetyltransferase, partial [Hominenteromicrobium sp.]
MKLELVPVLKEEKEILRNLMEKYDYEFSQYDNRDVNTLGLFGYDYFDCYWTEEGRYPFFIKADGKLAGFVMVGNYM